MQQKLLWFALSAGIMVTALFHATPAMATEPVGFTSTTIAKGQFSDIDAFNKFVMPGTGPDWTKRIIWRSRQKTHGLSDGYVLNNTWDVGGSTGWHTHLGHTLIIVTAGTLTEYEADCTPHVHDNGTTFVDPGGDHVHIIRNESLTDTASTIAVQLVPYDPNKANRRIDAPAPENCQTIF